MLYFSFHTDLNLKILKDDSACPGACQVIQWYGKGQISTYGFSHMRLYVKLLVKTKEKELLPTQCNILF